MIYLTKLMINDSKSDQSKTTKNLRNISVIQSINLSIRLEWIFLSHRFIISAKILYMHFLNFNYNINYVKIKGGWGIVEAEVSKSVVGNHFGSGADLYFFGPFFHHICLLTAQKLLREPDNKPRLVGFGPRGILIPPLRSISLTFYGQL